MSGIKLKLSNRDISQLIVTITLATLAASSNALGFTLLGGSKEVSGWKDKNLAFHLDPTNCPANVTSMITKARAVWNSVPNAGITLEAGSETSTNVADITAGTAPAVPAIVCVADMAAVGLNGSVIAGVAFGQRLDPSGALNYGGLALNVDPAASANISTIDEGTAIAVIAHELGHVLGIGHSTETKALMYYDGSKRKSATLHQDDVDALVYLYPRNEFDGDDLLGGCARVGAPSTGKIQLGSIVLFFPAFALLFRALRRRRLVTFLALLGLTMTAGCDRIIFLGTTGQEKGQASTSPIPTMPKDANGACANIGSPLISRENKNQPKGLVTFETISNGACPLPGNVRGSDQTEFVFDLDAQTVKISFCQKAAENSRKLTAPELAELTTILDETRIPKPSECSDFESEQGVAREFFLTMRYQDKSYSPGTCRNDKLTCPGKVDDGRNRFFDSSAQHRLEPFLQRLKNDLKNK